jgi:TonB-linked SusC/RagA family outer membrane protein
LKDASATAVYGVRGANGVVIVTTKRGQKGAAQINASFSSGMQQPTRLLEFADSYTYAQMFTEAQRNDNPDLTPEQQRFSPEVIEAFRTGSDPILFPNTNWMDYILKPSTMQNQGNVNIRGGTDRVNYFVSVGYLNQDGLFNTFESDYDYNFSYNRFNYRSNLDIKITESTQLGITTGGRVGIRNQPNAKDGIDELFRLIYWSVPFSGPGIVDGKYVTLGTDYIPEEKKDALDAYYGRGFSNLLNNNLNFDIDLSQKLDVVAKGLKFRTKLSYNSTYNHNKVRNSSVASYIPYYLGDVDPNADPDDKTIVYRRSGSDGNLSYSENFGKGRNWYFETGFSYNARFGNHNIGGLALYNHNRVYYPQQWSYIPTGLVGVVGRMTYDYDTRYMIDLNVGYNGSENFIREKRYGLFPAISLGWIPTQEEFMSSFEFLEYMKIRASYGLVGNDKIGGDRFLYLPDSYNPSQGGYNFGVDNPQNQTAATEGQIGNPNVTWETALKQNIGVDMVIFKNLSISYDYFIENRKDILTYRGTVPAFVAYELPAVNIGEVKNQGYEIDLKWNQRVNPSFNYYVRMNLSHSRNEIIYMDEVAQDEEYLYRTGHPVGQPFGYVFDRFFGADDADNGDIPDHQYELKPGDMIYRDLNNDGVINQNDVMAIGYPNYPAYAMGANMGFTWKNLDFSMSWVGATQTSRMLDESFRLAFGATSNRSLLQYMADGRWTPENAETATYPRLTILGRQNNSLTSDFYLRDASYIRLKNIELGYNFKGKALERIGMKSLRTFVNGYNLITIDVLEVADPESRTGSRPVYPLTKIYNIGVRANF